MSMSHALAKCQVLFCGPIVGTVLIVVPGLCYLKGQEDVCGLFCMWKPIIYAPTKCKYKESTFAMIFMTRDTPFRKRDMKDLVDNSYQQAAK